MLKLWKICTFWAHNQNSCKLSLNEHMHVWYFCFVMLCVYLYCHSLGGYPPFNTECSTMSVREQIISGHYRFIPSQWKKVSNEGNVFALHWQLDSLIACRYQFMLTEIFELKNIQCKLYIHFIFQPKIWSRSCWLWIPKSVWASKRRWHIRGWTCVLKNTLTIQIWLSIIQIVLIVVNLLIVFEMWLL